MHDIECELLVIAVLMAKAKPSQGSFPDELLRSQHRGFAEDDNTPVAILQGFSKNSGVQPQAKLLARVAIDRVRRGSMVMPDTVTFDGGSANRSGRVPWGMADVKVFNSRDDALAWLTSEPN